ncbi:aspartate aminotransferase family protein [Desertimonas flava]|jgi:adenosylmethionine-8-amino-7-oxononanoate aminotransferase|uniref:aminotransferase family protein n=1 Tax=Desertimonas flava TaxID=2064846 RepID=UPI000E34B0FF|nr:aminotransferase class III-fold pyridoxal phosphate-dependent enzyme [Desertimonas flava]
MSTSTTPRFLHPFAAPARPAFVEVVRGAGALLWTADGHELIDAMASLWYCNVGHGRGEIADAVAAQMRSIEAYSCFEPFTNAPADALAERVAALSPVPDARVFLCGSGSESIDTAIKLARLAQRLSGHPDRTVVVSRERGYHGTNLGGTSAQGIAPNREGWGPLVPEMVQVPSDDIEALSVLMSEHGDRIAAVISEPVQGAGGVFPPADGYLQEVRALCDRHGALMVLDEVITGFGRLGRWFAAEHYGVVPDMITFAKAVTSGYQQVGGVVIGQAVVGPLESDPAYLLRHGYTYSGHASSCAAGLANLDILEREELLDRAVPMGRRLADGLEAIAADGGIAGVRGVGAVWAIALRPDQNAVAVRDRMFADGVITRAIGADTCTFCPPLVTTDAQIDRIVDSVAGAVAP